MSEIVTSVAYEEPLIVMMGSFNLMVKNSTVQNHKNEIAYDWNNTLLLYHTR